MVMERIVRGSDAIGEAPSDQPLNIYELLDDYGVSVEELAEEDSPYVEKIIAPIDNLLQFYHKNPSAELCREYNELTIDRLGLLKEKFPDKFTEREKEEISPSSPQAKIREAQDILLMWVGDDDVDSVAQWIEKDSTKEERQRVLTSKNFKVYDETFRSRNMEAAKLLIDEAKAQNFYEEILTSRTGNLFALLVASAASEAYTELVSDAVDVLMENPVEAKKIFKKELAYQSAMESGHTEIISILDSAYVGLGMDVPLIKIEEKEEDRITLSEISIIGQIKKQINEGTLRFANRIVMDGQLRGEFGIFEDESLFPQTEKNDYHIYYPKKYEALIDRENAIELFTVGGVEIVRLKLDEFEKFYACTRHQAMNSWINLMGLKNIEDVFAIMFLANISKNLMVDRRNKNLRKEYKGKLKMVMDKSASNRIGDVTFSIKSSHLMRLRTAGFLDDLNCPTQLFYMCVVMHSYRFPLHTHPFEMLSMPDIQKTFTFDIISGEYDKYQVVTDGNILYADAPPHPVLTKKTARMLTDTTRTIMMNLTARERSDIEKHDADIDGFMPLIYSVPRAKHPVPSFDVRLMKYPKQEVMWGVYRVSSQNDNLFVNSFPVSNSFFFPTPDEAFLYSGRLANNLFDSGQGVIIKYAEGSMMIVRGFDQEVFFRHNYNQQYHDKVLGKQVLEKLAASVSVGLMTLVQENISPRSDKMYPDLNRVGAKEELEVPVDIEKITRKAKVKTVVKSVAHPDKRTYLGEKEAKELLSDSWLPVYEAVKDLKGVERDRAILSEMKSRNLRAILPSHLIGLGFAFDEWAVNGKQIVMGDFELRRGTLLNAQYFMV